MATVQYVWDWASDTYLMEKDHSGTTEVVFTNEPTEDGPIASQRQEGATSYFHLDGQQSVRQLSNAQATVVDNYVYSGFGTTIAGVETSERVFYYCGALGYYRDLSTFDYYVRRRQYSPSSGRWMSTDPVGAFGEDNLYCYCENLPVTLSDPEGLQAGKGNQAALKKCLQTAEKYFAACNFRGGIFCALVCLKGAKPGPGPRGGTMMAITPACAACVLLYHPGCIHEDNCNKRYCRDVFNGVGNATWRRIACGGALVW